MPAQNGPPTWLMLALAASVIAASLMYRRAMGKPVFFFDLPTASFLERFVSGHSNDNFLRRLGGARSCLVVGIVADRLIVRPIFPFNLLFLPEIYGLEHDINVRDVLRAELTRSRWRSQLVVTFRDGRARARSITLHLRSPDALAKLLRGEQSRS